MSDQVVRWGILTNGRLWRIYWREARSIAEDFLKFDLGAIVGLPGIQLSMVDEEQMDPKHFQKVFFLLFGKDAFIKRPVGDEQLSFHEIAFRAGRYWEKRISEDLGWSIFNDVFPKLGGELAHHDPESPVQLGTAYLNEIRQAALVFLYRLLFVFYAEDRNLLPVHDARYQSYSIRSIRKEIADRLDQDQPFSSSQTVFHDRLTTLYRAIAMGDPEIGLPPYNGGLFDPGGHPVLERIKLSDGILGPMIDRLSREDSNGSRKWINYRDLSVQHLGTIYERILEYDLVPGTKGEMQPRLNRFARRGSGSYYTHDDLVKLVIHETVGPLNDERVSAFNREVERLADAVSLYELLNVAEKLDPASAILDLKICDPAMGSAHFLVSLVDYLADKVIEHMASAPAVVSEYAGAASYVSPVTNRIREIRRRILANAEANRWNVDRQQLDDRHLIRRIILKRVIFGVDKNPMAVELAKVALWLHTFTVGAPLSFLDHHLKCGDSLFGSWLTSAYDEVTNSGYALFLPTVLSNISIAADELREISDLTDVDLEEVNRSKQLYAHLKGTLSKPRRLMDAVHAALWMKAGELSDDDWEYFPKVRDAVLESIDLDRTETETVEAVLTAVPSRRHGVLVRELVRRFQRHMTDLGFLHWDVAFPTVWRSSLTDKGARGGFDAVIGNPPWDRIKLQEVEWFATRREDVAKQPRAADRKRLISQLERTRDPLWLEYLEARQRAETTANYARKSGLFPRLSGGDINIYSLFVEQAERLIKPDEIVGLLTPSGIAADLSASAFFRAMNNSGRLAALYDFENKKEFFPDVHASFKFCALVFGGSARKFSKARCAFFLHSVAELSDEERTFALTLKIFGWSTRIPVPLRYFGPVTTRSLPLRSIAAIRSFTTTEAGFPNRSGRCDT